MFSIYILTHNEEIEIAECIESALGFDVSLGADTGWGCDDVVVVDSLSSDRTIDIAERYAEHHPVRVVQHAFESHGKQRTWMLRSVPVKHDWVYLLEADERMTPHLFQECLDTIAAAEASSDPNHPIAYYVAERVMFMGQWIRRSTQYPRYQLRLFRRDKVWFTDYGHTEREVVEGATGFLQASYPHYTCGKGMSRWLDKHNRYSTDEAIETIRQLEHGTVDWKAIAFGKTEVDRRRALKNASLRMPFRPLIRFFYMYFGLGGCFDGRAGFAWCVLQAFYEYLILLKVWELMQPNPPSTVSEVELPHSIAPTEMVK